MKKSSLMRYQEFPGSPVVRTPRFHCLRVQIQSLVRELRSHKLHGASVEKKSLMRHTERERKREREKERERERHTHGFPKAIKY